MEYPLLPKQMPERIQSVWRKTALLTTMAFILIGSAITGFLMWLDALEGFWFWLVIGYFGLVAIGLIISLALVPYRYHYYRFEVTPEDLAFQKGFIFRSITYVPMNRIQHVETEQGPFMGKEGLMEIVIHTPETGNPIAG